MKTPIELTQTVPRALIAAGALLGFLATPTTASASDLGLYIGASFVQTKFEHDWSELPTGLTVRDVDDEDQGFKVLFGWRPIPWFALEASYADLGAASGNTNAVCLAVVGYPCPTRLSADVQSTQLAALGLWPVGDFDLFARAGIQRWEADAEIGDAVTVIARAKEDDTDIVYGIGAQYRYKSVAVRLEFEHLELEESEAGAVSMGVMYSF
jgi:OOP family OmpA-OmpF porin